MWRYLVPGWRRTLPILLCVFATSLLGLLPPFLIRRIIDQAIPHRDGTMLNWLVATMIAAPLLAGLLGVWQRHVVTVMAQDITFDLRTQLYSRLSRQSLRFFTATHTGEILSRIQGDIGGVHSVIAGTFVAISANVLVLIATAIMLLTLDWRLALIALAVLPAFILPTRRVGRIRQQLSAERQARVAELMTHAEETLSVSGLLLTRLFGAHDYEVTRHREKADAIRQLQLRQAFVGRWFFVFLAMSSTIGPAVIYFVGGHAAIAGRLTIGTLVAFVVYLGRMYGPAAALANAHIDVVSAVALFSRIFDYLDQPSDIVEPATPVRLASPRGELRFEQVRMEYHPGTVVLDDITFTARPGQMLAIVGPTGAGKTTMTYLACRLFDPTSGRVTFDGVDLRDLALDDLSQWIASVTQESSVFHATIEENLRYGKPSATRDEIEQACRLAHIHDAIAALPDGYATVVGQRGYRLSGGEKQRLALARVLLRDPRIVVLDEATSALDPQTEAGIQATLEPLLAGRTVLVIAHRLSTVRRADQILVLDRGRLVERGTHDELLRPGTRYHQLHDAHIIAASSPR